MNNQNCIELTENKINLHLNQILYCKTLHFCLMHRRLCILLFVFCSFWLCPFISFFASVHSVFVVLYYCWSIKLSWAVLFPFRLYHPNHLSPPSQSLFHQSVCFFFFHFLRNKSVVAIKTASQIIHTFVLFTAFSAIMNYWRISRNFFLPQIGFTITTSKWRSCWFTRQYWHEWKRQSWQQQFKNIRRTAAITFRLIIVTVNAEPKDKRCEWIKKIPIDSLELTQINVSSQKKWSVGW